MAYQAKGFRHLTGVDTGLDAMSFYKKAVSGTLQANQIFFSSHHPYQLCQRKLVHLSDIAGMVTSECFMLENITTETQSFPVRHDGPCLCALPEPSQGTPAGSTRAASTSWITAG